MYKINEAGWDRILRIVLGVLLIFLGWAVFAGGLGLGLKLLGLVFLFTGIIGWCPIYYLFNLSTHHA
jgi:hypothetical protein